MQIDEARPVGYQPAGVDMLPNPRAPRVWPSRPGELHPEPLTDPDVNLSIHPARAIG